MTNSVHWSNRVRWSGRRCPKCQAELLTDGELDVCSLIGCDYGVHENVLAPLSAPESGERP